MGKQRDKALALHRAGALVEAERLYEGLYRRDRDDATVAYLLGVLRLGQGRNAEALQPLRRAVALAPGDFESLRACAEVLDRLGQPAESIVLHRRTVGLRPGDAAAHAGLGCASLAEGHAEAALRSFEHAAALGPATVEVQNNIGLSLRRLGRIADATVAFEGAFLAFPRHALAPYNLGKMLAEEGDVEAAEPWLERAIALAPAFADAKLVLAGVLRDLGRTDASVASVDAILAGTPDHPVASVWRCTMELPVLYDNAAETALRRARYAAALETLAVKVNADPARYIPGFAATRPFFLAYQGDDDRALQVRHGSLVQTSMAAGLGSPARPRERHADKLRIGIVSGYFRDHSVWKIPTRGWLRGLDRTRFELVCYHTGAIADAGTAEAIRLADRFVELTADLAAAAKRIAEDGCDALLYPEIGMDSTTTLLAALRLAPVQVNGLGHPVTSGLATMDFALSSALMEPPDAQAHYTETLLRLPNLGVLYDALDTPREAVTRDTLGLPAQAFLFWCGQSLFKYQPRYDETFALIAAAAPRSRFVFIQYRVGKAITAIFRQRLHRAFARHGSRMEDHCVFLPRLSSARFAATAGLCDAILDSLGWAGFNSTMESLAHDLPLVTWDGPFMRGRHGAAILRRMDVTETLAATPDAFVASAVRLATDRTYAADVRAKIASRKALLLGDRTPTDRLGDWLIEVTGAHRATGDRGNA